MEEPHCVAAWQPVRELMVVAAGERAGFRPGRVAVVRTFGEQLNRHAHVHALVPRGSHDDEMAETFDALDFVARLRAHVPDPRRRLVNDSGACADVTAWAEGFAASLETIRETIIPGWTIEG